MMWVIHQFKMIFKIIAIKNPGFSCVILIIIIIIIIIIKLCCLHGFPTHSLSIRPYRPSLAAGFPNCILCLDRGDIDKFFMVDQHWHVHVSWSIEERHLWVCLRSSSNAPHLYISKKGAEKFCTHLILNSKTKMARRIGKMYGRRMTGGFCSRISLGGVHKRCVRCKFMSPQMPIFKIVSDFMLLVPVVGECIEPERFERKS